MNIFSVTAPLMVRLPDNTRFVVAEMFPHENGLLFFEPFWHQMQNGQGIHVAEGILKGDGPWKIGDAVINVAGCHGTDPEIAASVADWQEYLQACDGYYMSKDDILAAARANGADI